METVAVYWEPIIKTYGFVEKTGLSLVSFPLTVANPEPRVRRYLNGAGRSGNLRLVFASSAAGGGGGLHLLFDGPPPADAGLTIPPGAHVDAPVELITFQGPHFGDRYGIAAAALSALASAQVPLRAAICAGASISLVVPQGAARPGVAALSRVFSVPTSSKSSRPKEPGS
jgi:hypothetical protein